MEMNYILLLIFLAGGFFNLLAVLKVLKLKKKYGIFYKRKLRKNLTNIDTQDEIKSLVTAVYKLQNTSLILILIFFLLFILSSDLS